VRRVGDGGGLHGLGKGGVARQWQSIGDTVDSSHHHLMATVEVGGRLGVWWDGRKKGKNIYMRGKRRWVPLPYQCSYTD